MKKSLLFFTALFASVLVSAQTTAVNFTCNDCAGASHTLFTELDAGKVIVITWVMPCGACIAGASTAAATVQGYASSNPGVVKFYLVDDYANTACHTLDSWASTNSITSNAECSDAVISMSDYGISGMPKTIVLGGTSHTVFYNQSGTPVVSDLQTAINSAIAATGIIENNKVNAGLTLFPNPAVNSAKLKYTLSKQASVNIDIVNVTGEKIISVSLGVQAAGKQEYDINLESLSSGIYFAKLYEGETSESVKLTVTR